MTRPAGIPSIAEMAQWRATPTGSPVLVFARLAGGASPHRGRLHAVLESGRVRVHVTSGGRTYTVLTDPTNVYLLSTVPRGMYR